MLLYSPSINPRLTYITSFIGKELLGEEIQVTKDFDVFKNFAGQKINYSAGRISDDEYWLKPHSLLVENNIHQQNIHCFEVNGHKAFFKTDGDFPFDIFAASFYLLTRYEEYLPHAKDMYERYAHENSLAYKEGFLNMPLINIWLQSFGRSLQSKFPNMKFQHSAFKFLPTYDIDESFSYRHKGWKRSAGGAIKNLLRGEFRRVAERRKVLNGKLPDPFDSYGWMDDLHRKYDLQPKYFFLVAEKNGPYDKQILPSEIAQQTLIRHHADKYEMGVHPSWQSGENTDLIKKEKETLEKITKLKVISSRQHYIRCRLPQTYRALAEANIKEDFSMGYGSINGFRASVTSPFYWYDLEKEQTSYLLLYPFCFMDANSFYEQQYSPGKALEEMHQYYNEVKKVNGLFITIWHNPFLGTDEKFRGWRDVYEKFVKEITGQV